MEKAICLQLTEYLEKFQIFPELQSAFRKGRNTSSTLLDVNMLSAQDMGLCTILVLLVFSRAFDYISIDLLITKLGYYGFDLTAQQ